MIRSPVQEGYTEWLIRWLEKIRGEIKERHWWQGWTKDWRWFWRYTRVKGKDEWMLHNERGTQVLGRRTQQNQERKKYFTVGATTPERKMKEKVKGKEQRIESRSWERFPKKIRCGRWAPISHWPECREGRSTWLCISLAAAWRSLMFPLPESGHSLLFFSFSCLPSARGALMQNMLTEGAASVKRISIGIALRNMNLPSCWLFPLRSCHIWDYRNALWPLGSF